MKHLLTPYTFGCMSLGKDPAHPEADVALVRKAMDTGISFHGSRTYNNGFSFMILRLAFDQARHRIPNMIHKVRDASPVLMRFETEDICDRLGLDHLDIAQLTAMDRDPGNLVDQLQAGDGPLVQELADLKHRGLIHHAVLFMDKHNADASVAAAQHELIDGVTLYWNALQRSCTDTAWAEIVRRQIPVLAIRTLGGWRDPGLAQQREALQQTLPDIDPVNLALRLAASQAEILTSIGGTASPEHFDAFLAAANAATPLTDPQLRIIESIRA